VLAPLFTLIHELGHAFLPILNGEMVMVRVGEDSIITLKVKNLSISFGLSKPWVGYASWNGENKISYLLLGPLTSLISGLAFIGLGISSNRLTALLFSCAGFCLFQFLFTIAPMTYPDWLGYGRDQLSDGRQILNLMSKSNSN